MLKIKLTDGTVFQWEHKEGLQGLAGNCSVGDLARLKLNEIEFVEANSEEKLFITTSFDNIRINNRGTTRWVGEEAKFIANNLRNAAIAERRRVKKIERKGRKKCPTTKQPYDKAIKKLK